MKKFLCLLSVVLIMTGCNNTSNVQNASSDVSSGKLKKYSDIRVFPDKEPITYTKDQYTKEDIPTYTFNDKVFFEGNEEYQKEIMEAGKDPGLGIRSLHEQGITGKGVNVAIIDYPMFLDHPEYKGKIVKYYDSTSGEIDGQSSMHGPGVTSLLVGESMGSAPHAKVYYAAVPSLKDDDYKYSTDALYWIIAENKKLSKNEKIRIVSISDGPSENANKNEWENAVKEAEKNDILIVDCAVAETGFIRQGYFKNIAKRKSQKDILYGFPSENNDKYISAEKERAWWSDLVVVPISSRTVAEEYTERVYGYTYYGEGGLSWGIPYAAGVMALGWQANPNLSANEMKKIFIDSAYKGKYGFKYIDPVNFIKEVKKTVMK